MILGLTRYGHAISILGVTSLGYSVLRRFLTMPVVMWLFVPLCPGIVQVPVNLSHAALLIVPELCNSIVRL